MSDRNKSWTIDAGDERLRLDQFLVSRLPGESRSQIQNWIRKGYIRVNGEQAKTGYLIRLNDLIALHIPETPSDQPFPEDIPLDVLYEDSDLAVINKKLNNESFLNKAPAEVVADVRDKQSALSEKREKIESTLQRVRSFM